MVSMETAGMQHVAARKRVFTSLSPFPHPSGFRRYFDFLIYIVGTLAPLALVPQVVEIFSTRSAEGFALVSWTAFVCINALWVAYALLHRERAILIANAGMGIMNASVVLGILLYG